MKNALLCTLTLLLITACDPYATEKFMVKNTSTYFFEVVLNDYDTISTFELNPDNEIVIYSDNFLGYADDMGERFLDGIQSLYILVNDTLEVNKNCMERDSWDYILTGENSIGDGGTANYTLTVSNTDIVIK